MKRNLLVVFLLALAIRLIALNQSLWIDEATTAKVATQFGYFAIPTTFSPFDFHPPLYYMVMKAWVSVAGSSEISLRLPSVLFSLVAGWFVYLAARRLRTTIDPVAAAALFLFNPLIVYYSQEARMYMMATAFLAIAVWAVIGLLRQPDRRRDLIIANCAMALAFLTFYGSIFFIAAVFIGLAYRRRWRLVAQLAPGMVIAGVLVLPLFRIQMIHSHQSLSLVSNWKSTLGTITLKNLLLVPLKFMIGRVQFLPKKLYYLIAGGWAAVVFGLAMHSAKRQRYIGYLLGMPLLLGVVTSAVTPLLQYFRFQFLIVPLALLLAEKNSRWQRYIVLAGFILWSAFYLLGSGYHREDWQSLARSLPQRDTVYMIGPSADALRYYRPDIQVQELRGVSAATLPSKITIIPYAADIYGLPYQQILERKGYSLQKAVSYRGVVLEYWARSLASLR